MLLFQNHRVERLWSEVNQRVNYPLKAGLVDLGNRDIINMDDDITKMVVSSLTMQLCSIGLKRVVPAWNCHRIPGL